MITTVAAATKIRADLQHVIRNFLQGALICQAEIIVIHNKPPNDYSYTDPEASDASDSTFFPYDVQGA